MKVELINKDQIKSLFENWGEVSSVCYNSNGNTRIIGKHCLDSGHFSGSRCEYFKFKVTSVPRFLIDQSVRKEVGTVKNVESTRYVDYDNFVCEIPSEILDNPLLLKRFAEHTQNGISLYKDIQTHVQCKCGSHERANEQARYVLPMGTHSNYVIAYTLESLIDVAQSRLCVRSEDMHRELTMMMVEEVVSILPELKNVLVPKCKYLTWCPEKKSCGAYPRKED